MVVKISDFGISKFEDDVSKTKTQKAGTSFFMSPEVISSTRYDYKCDVYSFGIIMYQVLVQCSENDIYPQDKLDGKNLDFMLSTDKNFRPELSEDFLKKEEHKEYIGLFFFKFFF
jgi:serine/threonine protein kinase